MKKKLFPIALVVTCALVSCQKEETPVKPAPSEWMTFTASISGIDTKTTLSAKTVNWEDGDEISINGVKFIGTPISYQTPNLATFTIADNQMPPEAPFYAFFPYGIQIQGVNCGTLPDEQIYSKGKFDNVPMYAYNETVGMLTFHNICGVLAVKVSGEDIDQVASIRVSSTDQAMSGDFEVRNNVAVLTDEAKENMGNVVLTCEEPVAINADTTIFHIAIPAQTYSNINIELSSDGVNYTKGMLTRSNDSITVECGRIYTVAFKADAPTANCYIAAGAVTDTIKAVKGNTPELVSGIKSVKVLWESFGTDQTPGTNTLIQNVTYSKGLITYNTNDTSGNAVIAAYDGEDGKGSILWSWHIWLCKDYKDSVISQVYNNDAGILMDRNLGATSLTKGDAKSFGLLYQWGRKDPFLGADAKGSSNRAASTYNNWRTASAPQSVDFTLANPTTFIVGISGLWTLNVSAIWNKEKTVSDPCPVGWRVPEGSLRGVWYNAANGEQPPLTPYNEGWGYECGGANGYFTQPNSCWYPISGFIEGTNGNINNTGYGYQWSCTRIPLLEFSAFCLECHTSGINMDQNIARNNGQSVRCQKIEEE